MKNKTMLTDLYQLTMNAAYFENKKDDIATFDLFIRKLPEDWSYFIACGVEDAIDYATSIKFEDEDIEYLRSQGLFKEDYLQFLKNFKFEGEIYAVSEGTPVAPNTPILRVTAKRTQAQLLETTLLNIINFQTMIATKARRVVMAAGRADVIDFGLRRAQGEDAALKGARAAYIAGAIATSNVKAGKEYGIPIAGTHAHSFVMSFPTELDAFRAYVKTFPENATLLIDTYDTENGARNAAIIAKELETKGKKLGAVRLDSGDLCDLSKKVREILDKQDLQYVKIFASNDLNEYKIKDLRKSGAKIDGFGVGTEMITAKPVAAISGVYKLVEDNDGPKIKLSEDKRSYPGKKQVYRFWEIATNYYHGGKYILYDLLALEGERIELGKMIIRPGVADGIYTQAIPLLEQVIKEGRRIRKKPTLEEIRENARIDGGHPMKISEGLQKLVDDLTEKYGGRTK